MVSSVFAQVRRLLVQEANSTSCSTDDEVTCKYGRKGLRFFLPPPVAESCEPNEHFEYAPHLLGIEF